MRSFVKHLCDNPMKINHGFTSKTVVKYDCSNHGILVRTMVFKNHGFDTMVLLQ